jgi:hypothetical protein
VLEKKRGGGFDSLTMGNTQFQEGFVRNAHKNYSFAPDEEMRGEGIVHARR